MPEGIYKNYTCIKKHKKFTPQTHQIFIREYFIKSPYKGLLLYHRLGSGKTCSSIITADALLKLHDTGIKAVYILSPGSLRQGWLNEYCNVCGIGSQWLSDNYTFVTYNYNVAGHLPSDFNNSLIIIDEVHNFINGVKNRSKNAEAIYAKIMLSTCKILALSGTPIYNNIYEWSLLGSMLKPDSMPPIILGNKLMTKDFMDLFVTDDLGNVTPIDATKFNDAVSGIISYFPGVSEKFYPKVIYEPIINIKMTPPQDNRYIEALTTEEEFLHPPDERLKFTNPAKYRLHQQMYMVAKKRILSRQPLNFIYPKEVYEGSEKEGWVKPHDELFPYGWVEPKYFTNKALKNDYSPKMATLIENILKNFRAKHMIFTFFKEHSGVNIIRAMLKMCGLRTEAFSGDLSDKGREKLLKEFNSKENRYGDVIKAILVTDAGSEGITLLEVGHVHILESDTRENKIQQAIGRAVRYKSHINMPDSEQVVHIWRYWSTFSNGDPTMDEKLYTLGLKKITTINSFLKLLIDNSIEKHVA